MSHAHANSENSKINKQELHHKLWYNREWIHRRVDEITIEARDKTVIKSTFDLDIARLRTLLNRLENEEQNGNQIALPLMILPRLPLLDVDVDLNGKPQSFASTSTSADIMRCILIEDYLQTKSSNPSNEEDVYKAQNEEEAGLVECISDVFYEWLYTSKNEEINDGLTDIYPIIEKYNTEIESAGKSDTDRADRLARLVNMSERLYTVLSILLDPNRDKNDINIDGKYRSKWVRHSRFTSTFIGAVLVDLPADTQRAKLTFTITISAHHSWSLLSWIIPLRLQPIQHKIPGTLLGSGNEKRYHCRINAPEGHYITKIKLLNSKEKNRRIPLTNSEIKSKSANSEYNKINIRIAALPSMTYLEIHDRTQFQEGVISGADLLVGFEPFFRNFMIRAIISILFMLAYLCIAKYAVFDSKGVSPYIVSILALILSLPNWFKAGDEHDFMRATLRKGRLTLGFITCVSIVVGFITQLASFQKQVDNTSHCLGINDVDRNIISEHRLCELALDRMADGYLTALDLSWELTVLLCCLYIFGIIWFSTRTFFNRLFFRKFNKVNQ